MTTQIKNADNDILLLYEYELSCIISVYECFLKYNIVYLRKVFFKVISKVGIYISHGCLGTHEVYYTTILYYIMGHVSLQNYLIIIAKTGGK